MAEVSETEIIIDQPDDGHLHLRDGLAMASVVMHSAWRFGRAIIMPNLRPPITTMAQSLLYLSRILGEVRGLTAFDPLMTLYLTDETSPDEIERAKKDASIVAVKLYPAGATTNSESGVTDLGRVYPVLERMQKLDFPLLVHGEVTDPKVDIFDREVVFIDRVLSRTLRDFPGLRIVLEHITTREAVDFVTEGPSTLAATITAHHLLYNRNAIFAGGICPHYYCLPVLKRESHRQALVQAATSGNPKFFLGTDSAPHGQGAKESACGCAGIYTAHAGIELYAEAFEQASALDKLEGFASHFGADFYRLPRNTWQVKLMREPWKVPQSYPFGNERLIPFRAGEEISWRYAGAVK